MFTQNDYNDLMSPEPDNGLESHKKKGISCFLSIAVEQSISLLKLNLLFLLGCVPVVTIPLSLFAMSQVVCKMILDQPVKCLHDYLETFRRNWRLGYLAFFLTVLPMGCAAFGMWFYFGYVASNLLFFLPFLMCSTIFLVTLLSSGYLYALLGRKIGMKEAVRLALLLGVTKPLRAVLAALSYYGLLLVAILLFPLSGLYFLLIGFSFPCLLGNFFLRTVLTYFTDSGSDSNEDKLE